MNNQRPASSVSRKTDSGVELLCVESRRGRTPDLVGGERSANAVCWLNDQLHVGCEIFHGDAAILDVAESRALARPPPARSRNSHICISRRNSTNPYTTPAWRQLSLAVILRDGACVERGRPDVSLHAHHVEPRAEGGSDTLENLVALCVSCHGRETAVERR